MMGIAQRVINSGARGAVAAMAMTGTRSLTGSLGLMSETPPEAVLHQQVPGLMVKIPKSKQPAVVELAHWTFGVVAGAVYAMLPSGLRRCRWAGAVYGLVVLTGFEAGIAPLLGLSQSRHLRLVERLVFLADHALFGVVLAPPRLRVVGGSVDAVSTRAVGAFAKGTFASEIE